MIFAPIAYKKTANLSNTVTNLGNAPSTTPGSNIWGYEIDNTSNAPTTYLQLFNLPASQVTLGVTVPDLVFACGASSARGFGYGPQLIFDKGMSGAVTTTKNGRLS